MAVTTRPEDRPRGAARRLALIEAALQIVAEVGADSVTHRRVAEAAGLPLASTTYWFDSKEDLLTAALQHAAEQDIARLEAFALSLEGSTDPVDRAVAAIVEPVDVRGPGSRTSLLASYTLLLEAARRPALRDLTQNWTTAYLDLLAPMLEAAGSRVPRADAELLLAAADGLLMEQLAIGDPSDPSARLRRLAAALVRQP
jgi:DNA-binding transcriptional regulator YbjK